MSSTVATVAFDRCRSRIDELLDAHIPMGLVERMIDAYALDREEKDALWLWASARRDQLLNGASEHPTIGSTALAQAADAYDTPRSPDGPGHD